MTANFDLILKMLRDSGDGIRGLDYGRSLTYQDDNVRMVFLFSPSHCLLEVKCIWYANNYQCLKFVDLTEKGCLKYFRKFGLKVNTDD